YSRVFLSCSRHPCALHSFPTRRSSDLLQLARGAFFVHGVAIFSVIACLFNIIYAHRYEYYYAWSHSSNHLPVQYMISCFWEGQEDRKSTRLNSSHVAISYAVFCLKKKN